MKRRRISLVLTGIAAIGGSAGIAPGDGISHKGKRWQTIYICPEL